MPCVPESQVSCLRSTVNYKERGSGGSGGSADLARPDHQTSVKHGVTELVTHM